MGAASADLTPLKQLGRVAGASGPAAAYAQPDGAPADMPDRGMAPPDESKEEQAWDLIESESRAYKALALESYLAAALRPKGRKGAKGGKARGPSKTHLVEVPLRLAYETSIACTAGGVLASYANNDPSPAPGWSGLSGTFSEYRVDRVTLTVVPYWNVNNATQNLPYCYSCIDEESSAASVGPSTAAEVVGHVDTCEMHDGHSKWSRTWNVQFQASNPDDTWTVTSAPAATGAIKFYGDGILPVSTNCVRIHVVWHIRFRGYEA